jgi:ABC-type multidrug transport system fused ATPase/permease subunit
VAGAHALIVSAWLDRVVFRRAWLTFIVLVASFLVFGAGTYNLFLLLKANLDLIAEHGAQALADGAAQQFVELMFTAAISMAAYVLFKACEHQLVRRLCDRKKP